MTSKPPPRRGGSGLPDLPSLPMDPDDALLKQRLAPVTAALPFSRQGAPVSAEPPALPPPASPPAPPVAPVAPPPPVVATPTPPSAPPPSRRATPSLAPSNAPAPTARASSGRSTPVAAQGRGLAGTTSTSVMLPDYVNRQIRVAAAERGVAVRFVVLEALHRAGFQVNAEDMVEDGRRRR